MRLFVAVDMDERIKENLKPLIEKLSQIKGLKAVEKENLHTTLIFLGEVPEAKLADIQKALSRVEFESFKIALKGIGRFPNRGDPRVIWVAILDGKDEIVRLADSVYSELRKLGFKRDKPFEAHITVARVKRKIPGLDEILEDFKNADFGEMVVREFKLKQSILTPSGPIYKDIYIFGGKNG